MKYDKAIELIKKMEKRGCSHTAQSPRKKRRKEAQRRKNGEKLMVEKVALTLR